MNGLTEKQQDARQFRLGGSSTPAYLGESPWQSPLTAWRVAMGLEEVTETDQLVGGNVLEDGIAEMAERDLGGIKTYKPDTVYHPTLTDAIAVHFDRLCDEDSIGIQIKNHHPMMGRIGTSKHQYQGYPTIGEYHNHLVPFHIQMQCQWEMMVVEAVFGGEWGKKWILASYFGGAKPRIYFISRDRKIQKPMLKLGMAFWGKHLDPYGSQEEPIGYYWCKEPKPEVKPVRVTNEGLSAEPVPFATDGKPVSHNIPFSVEE